MHDLRQCLDLCTILLVFMAADPVHLNIEEKLTVVLNKQGGLDSLEVQVSVRLAPARLRLLVSMQSSMAASICTEQTRQFNVCITSP